MANKEDYLFRPVMEGMCRLESLKDGTLSLLDICKANEALDVRAENEWRARNTK